MRKVLFSISAVAAVLAFSVKADDKTYKRHISESNEKAYCVEYVPSTYLYNTRGKKVVGESRSWVGEFADGATIVKRRNPAVYKTTRKLVEQDHYTLVEGPC
ncbi:hypothetical protein VQ042_16095 [Aurantimonas sp. A2-1-M11]|uniref:hypothetical protein n=1 Tax=Aurantimonas sp. A2-1-M11 TaxID=3113712 RepID=UPI002F946DC4